MIREEGGIYKMNARNIWLMISVGLGIMLNPLNSSMISIAIARLQHVYQLDVTTVSWIIFSFYIASAVAQPVMGKCSDLFVPQKDIPYRSGCCLRFLHVSSVISWLFLAHRIPDRSICRHKHDGSRRNGDCKNPCY